MQRDSSKKKTQCKGPLEFHQPNNMINFPGVVNFWMLPKLAIAIDCQNKLEFLKGIKLKFPILSKGKRKGEKGRKILSNISNVN